MVIQITTDSFLRPPSQFKAEQRPRHIVITQWGSGVTWICALVMRQRLCVGESALGSLEGTVTHGRTGAVGGREGVFMVYIWPQQQKTARAVDAACLPLTLCPFLCLSIGSCVGTRRPARLTAMCGAAGQRAKKRIGENSPAQHKHPPHTHTHTHRLA